VSSSDSLLPRSNLLKGKLLISMWLTDWSHCISIFFCTYYPSIILTVKRTTVSAILLCKWNIEQNTRLEVESAVSLQMLRCSVWDFWWKMCHTVESYQVLPYFRDSY
jgi:hypothetical protein